MSTAGVFPFGQPVETLVQGDRSPKKVFVLGVYASAVHARWIGPDGRNLVRALAVASEPHIFWRGEGAEEIINRITMPTDLGRLVPADYKLNGPSGVALDELFLHPLGITRDDAWLCDLVPHSCVNPTQQKAIDRAYMPLVERYGLPVPSVPSVPRTLADDARRRQILEEIQESRAEAVVLLGDEPIRWFLRHFDDCWRRLSDFEPYGRRHPVQLDDLDIDVLPLVHPRQAARLGRSSKKWFELHELWRESIGGKRTTLL